MSYSRRQETQGVCVATFGRSRHFPAFFTPQSGFASPYNVANSQEAAELIGKEPNVTVAEIRIPLYSTLLTK